MPPDTGVDASRVHHLKHVGKPLIRLSAQKTGALVMAAEVQFTGWRGMKPSFSFHPFAEYIIRSRQGSVGVPLDFGHDKKRIP